MVKEIYGAETGKGQSTGQNAEKWDLTEHWSKSCGKVNHRPTPMKMAEQKGTSAADGSDEDFAQEFLRFEGLFKQVAERVLNGDDDVEEAIARSYDAAVSQRQKFQNDGEFRRWLVRTVFNQALMILHERESAAEASSEWIFCQTC